MKAKGHMNFLYFLIFKGQDDAALPTTPQPSNQMQLIPVVFSLLIPPTQRQRLFVTPGCCLCPALMIRSPLWCQSDFLLKYKWHLHTTFSPWKCSLREKEILWHRQMKDLFFFWNISFSLQVLKLSACLLLRHKCRGRDRKDKLSFLQRSGKVKKTGKYRRQQWKRKASWFLRTAEENCDRGPAKNQEVSLEIWRQSWIWFLSSILSSSIWPPSLPFTNPQSLP